MATIVGDPAGQATPVRRGGGTARTRPAEEVIPDWQERLAAWQRWSSIRTIHCGHSRRAIRIRRAQFGTAGLVTYTINDARRTVTLIDVTWAG